MPPPKPKPPKGDPEAAFTAGLRLLARREHSGFELGRKLRQRGFTHVAEAVDRLRADGLLSDARFAASMVRHRLAQGYGDLRIRFELSQHALSEETVDSALRSLDVDWVVQALAQARRKARRCPENGEERQRLLHFLVQRGFAPGVAVEALAKWRESEQFPE